MASALCMRSPRRRWSSSATAIHSCKVEDGAIAFRALQRGEFTIVPKTGRVITEAKVSQPSSSCGGRQDPVSDAHPRSVGICHSERGARSWSRTCLRVSYGASWVPQLHDRPAIVYPTKLGIATVVP